MKSFLLKLFIFVLPIFILLGIPFGILWKGGEFITSTGILAQRTCGQVLVGRAYFSDVPPNLNVLSVQTLHPDVVVLGNSRVLEIRNNFFVPTSTFYNAGRSVTSMSGFKKFLDHIPVGKEPKILLVGIDQSFFLSHETASAPLLQDESWVAQTNVFLTVWKKVYTDIFRKKITLSDLKIYPREYQGVGFNAQLNKNGIRNDGSYYYGKIISHPQDEKNEDFGFRDSLRRVDHGDGLFAFGEEVSSQSLTELSEFLTAAADRHIHVVAFLPPYAPTVFSAMNKKSDEYSYQKKILAAIEPEFKKFGFVVKDFSNPAVAQITDSEMIDGFHTSEKATLRFFLQLAQQDASLQNFISLDALNKSLYSSQSNLEVFCSLCQK